MQGRENLNNAISAYFLNIEKENPFQTLKFKLAHNIEWYYENEDDWSKDPGELVPYITINEKRPGTCINPSLQIIQKRHACRYLYHLLNGNDKYQLFCLYYLIDDENIKQQAKEILGVNFPEIKPYLDWIQRNITFNYESLFIWGELSLGLSKEFIVENADLFAKKNLEHTRWNLPCFSLNDGFNKEIFIDCFEQTFKKAPQAYADEQALIEKHTYYTNNKSDIIISFMTEEIRVKQKALLIA